MTLKEFLEMNTNGVLQVRACDRNNTPIANAEKSFFLEEEIFTGKVVMSFEVNNERINVKLDI